MGQYLDLTQFDLLQTQAENILALFQRRLGFPNRPPVPVEMIAQELFGLRCESRKVGHLGKRTVGALSVDDRIIYLDERCNRHQYVFSVAHEIGHWVLHEGNHCSQLHFGNTQSIPLSHVLTSTRAKTKKKRARRREIEANRFAGALLIPRTFLLSEAENYELMDAKAIGELARAFYVSMRAMLYRVMDLSEHLAWSGPRIDWDSLYRLETVLTRPRRTENQSTHPGSPTSPLGDEVIASADIRDRRRQTTLSTRRHDAIQALDFLIQYSRREPPEQLLSPLTLDSSEEYSRQPFHNASVANVIGRKQRSAKVAGDCLRKRKHHQGRGSRKALIVEFAGTSNAGKDTQIYIIKDYLEDVHKYNVKIIDEAVKTCRWGCGLTAETIHWSVSHVVHALHEASLVNPADYDFVIFNRGLFDLLALIHAACLHGTISEEQEQSFLNYLLPYARRQDIVFLFLISPEEAIRREYESKRKFVDELARHYGKTAPPQSILNEEMLTLLNSSYIHTYHSYKELFGQIYPLGLPNGEHVKISGDQQGIMERALGLTQLILPDSVQLPIPDLFDVCYIHPNSSNKAQPASRQSLPKSTGRSQVQYMRCVQLSFLETIGMV